MSKEMVLQKQNNQLKTQLAAKANELKIQTALEKVRAIALRMKQPADMLKICRTISLQLQRLGVKEIRNVQTAIFYKDKSTYMNYEYYAKHDKTLITETSYNHNKVHKAFAVKMQKGKGEFFVSHIKGAKVKDWIAYQKTTNVFIDKYLETASSLNYYWYSLGPVALGISTYAPLTKENQDLFKRFLHVFELAYRRYLDIEKAEAQAREAQIQLALERIRARTMAMQKSDELADVAQLLSGQVKELGINAWTAGFNVWQQDGTSYIDWVTDPKGGFLEPYTVDLTSHPLFARIAEAKQRGDDFYVSIFEGNEIKEIYELLNKFANKGQYQKILDSGFQFPSRQINHFVFGLQVSLLFITYEPVPEAYEIFKRFGKVFEQSYTRFLDLQKAEAQAREAQIEAALEKIRSRSLAMHRSDELRDVVTVVFEKLKELRVPFEDAGLELFKEGTKESFLWVAAPDHVADPVFVNNYYEERALEESEIFRDLWMSKETGESFFNRTYSFDEKNRYFDYLERSNSTSSVVPAHVREYQRRAPNYTLTRVSEKHSALSLDSWTSQTISAEDFDVVKRMAKVFEQAYVRFLDLQTAEAQAREAQIEAALERVRSRTMAMQHSEELTEVANLLFQQVQALGVPAWSCGFNIWEEKEKSFTGWMSSEGILQPPFKIPFSEVPTFNHFYESRQKGELFYVEEVGGEALAAQYEYMRGLPGFGEILDDFLKSGFALPTFQIQHVANFLQGNLIFITSEPVPEAHAIFKRFAKVFEQTYTRFLDLQKVEAQAKEAQIEVALERVRASTMAMHKSEELSQTASVLFAQLSALGNTPDRISIGIINQPGGTADMWLTDQSGNEIDTRFILNLNEETTVQKLVSGWKSGLKSMVVDLTGEELRKWLAYVRSTGLIVKDEHFKDRRVHNVAFFSHGWLNISTLEPLPAETMKVLERFATVYSLTYRRFLDLQKAEASAKAAIKQAALDRIRADIASMRTVNDLDRITPIIWNELTILKVPFIRCGVFIMDNGQQLIHTFLSTPDGKAIAAFHIPYDMPGNIQQVISHWRSNKNYIDHWDENAFTEFAETLVKYGALASSKQYLATIPHGGFYLHYLPFLQGMLYVGDTNRLSEDDINLMQSISDAFSTAYARYEDFNKLEAAKKQVDNALDKLRATQKQLIQSEKMASLGELTAGIAHEIQNPLNFVNNFSEVNTEMIEELKTELASGNWQLANEIADDIKSNEEKINRHGKRADAIVKSMLEHSRSSTGIKEPTDINKLADEYLRLSYHGLRAKDKSFNAEMITDFDASIGKINLIPQDIGRVLLNLFNNAFYACAERKRNSMNERQHAIVNEEKSEKDNWYQPTVWVTTKREENSVTITVRDNGGGIPDSVKEKIFQPFFTTKPTGEGTGLGLSLSYDIIKAHGGEIKVETKESGGSEFIIQLPTA